MARSKQVESDTDCPFCGAGGSCEHLFLEVDQDDRTFLGGAGVGVADRIWDERRATYGEDPDYRELRSAFSDLVDELTGFADERRELDLDDQPGLATTRITLFARDGGAAAAARLEEERPAVRSRRRARRRSPSLPAPAPTAGASEAPSPPPPRRKPSR